METSRARRFAADLPAPRPHRVRGGPARSRRGRARAAALLAVHLAIVAHLAHWRVSGTTLSPVEPSEAMRTLELGWLNAGFLLFVALIAATLVAGRFFCGWACHVVAYQDACAWLLGRLGLRPRPVRSRLLVLVPFALAAYMFVWPTLQRIAAGEPTPQLELHLVTRDFWATFPGPVVACLTLLVDGFLVVWLLGSKGFCTYGCPYGAIFALCGSAAPGRIRVNADCEGCGHCTAVCTSNVRVHEEVARFGQVVDPGCMRCLDCVSACPKQALSFSFRKRAARARWGRPRRGFDLSWPEELLAALVFLAATWAYRGALGKVPLLLAVGLGLLVAGGAVAAARALRSADFTLQGASLRRQGRWTATGVALGLGLAGLSGFALESGAVRIQAARGEAALVRARDLAPGAERVQWLARAERELQRAGAVALFGHWQVEQGLGAILADRGDWEGAARHYRRALALEPRADAVRAELGQVLLNDLRLREARPVVEELVRRRPRDARGWRELADLWILSRDYERALTALQRLLELRPGDERARRDLARAREALER